MSFWSRLLGGPSPPARTREPARAGPGESPPPDRLGDPVGDPVGDDAERFVNALLDQLSGPAPGPEAVAQLDGEALLHALDRLAPAVRGRTAIDLLRRLVALPEALYRRRDRRAEMLARLTESLVERMDHAAAAPVLAAIADHPRHGPRARFLLGEAAERLGSFEEARRQYELVLAADIDFPRARARHARLLPEIATGTAPLGAPTMAGLEVDRTTVGERYRLRSELGRGATSTVYLAHDVELDRDVALKLVHAQASARAAASARMRSWSEARVASALRHPGVVAIYDLDEDHGLLAMELCAGGTLRERLLRGRLPPVEAVRHARSLFATLSAVHAAGIVHRDLKPGNLLFRIAPPLPGEPAVDDLVLADFGLALLGDAAASTRPAAGTLDYLAPEARRGEPSAPSDLYACGVVLHEMLVGARPLGQMEVLRGTSPAAPAELPPAVETAVGAEAAAVLRRLLTKLLAQDPAARPTAREALAALDAIRLPSS